MSPFTVTKMTWDYFRMAPTIMTRTLVSLHWRLAATLAILTGGLK